MGQHVFLYEKNAVLRDEVAALVQAAGVDLVCCISTSLLAQKIAKIRQQSPDAKFIVMSNEQDIPADYRAYVRSYEPSDVTADWVRAHLTKTPPATGTAFDVVVIGSSTGGFPVVQDILATIKPRRSSVIVCQHISNEHSQTMKEDIEQRSDKTVVLVNGGLTVEPGAIYLLAGGLDYSLRFRYGQVKIEVAQDEASVYHPSFNKLISSLSEFSQHTIGVVVLSGLGNDGADALVGLPRENFELIVQDPKTATATGMPTAAIATGVPSSVHTAQSLPAFLKGKVA